MLQQGGNIACSFIPIPVELPLVRCRLRPFLFELRIEYTERHSGFHLAANELIHSSHSSVSTLCLVLWVDYWPDWRVEHVTMNHGISATLNWRISYQEFKWVGFVPFVIDLGMVLEKMISELPDP